MIFKKFKNKRKDDQVRVMSREDQMGNVLKWEEDVKAEPEKKTRRTYSLGDLDDNDIEPIDDPENYRVFKNGNEAEQWGRSIYDSWGKKIMNFENVKRYSFMFSDDLVREMPLKIYCGNGYEKINGFLRLNRKVDDKHKYMALTISEQLLLAPRIPENIVLYRYVDEKFISELIYATKNVESSQYFERGFTSTSLLKSIIKDGLDKCEHTKYAPSKIYLLKLYVDKGTVGAYVNPIVKRDEYEMLLQNNLFLRVCGKPYYDNEYKIMVVECKTRSFVTEF